jgi:3-hydroxybutyryl-CoA dehydrogenase
MQLADITQVGVVGAGTMGAGIAEVFAEAGYAVIWYNRSTAGLQRGLARIRANQATLIRYGGLTPAAAEAALSRLHPTTDLTALAAVAVISESLPEQLAVKQELFQAVERICPPQAVMTTNTSGLPVSQLASVLAYPARFAGMHFANPPHIIPMVEIVRGKATAEATCEALRLLLHRLGKHPVLVKHDVPGFIANRLQFAVLREALHLVETGVASPADIDAAMQHGIGLRWAFLGPFEIADVGGVDVFHAIAGYLLQTLSNTTEVSPVLQDLVASGRLGAKSGAGFYDYASGTVQQLIANRDARLLQLLHLKHHSAETQRMEPQESPSP